MGNTTSVLNLVMEKIGEAFLWLKSKIEEGLSYLSNVTTKCLSDARRFCDNFAEGFKEKLVQSKRSIDETIAKVAGILSNFPKNIVTNLIQVKDLVASMVRLMSNLLVKKLERFFGCMSELWKKVKKKCMDLEFAQVLCKVKDLYSLVEGFLELLEILLPFQPVSVVILVMEVVVLYSMFPNMTVSEMKEFKNFPEGKRKAAVFVYVFIQLSSSLLYDKCPGGYFPVWSWMRSFVTKVEDVLSRLSKVTTTCLEYARPYFDNFCENFKDKLLQSKGLIDETIAKVADIIGNILMVVTDVAVSFWDCVIQLKNLVVLLIKLLWNLAVTLVKKFVDLMKTLRKKTKIKCQKLIDEISESKLITQICVQLESFLKLFGL